MLKNPRDYKGLMATGRWFGALEATFQDRLLELASVRRVAASQRLFARGDPPDGLYGIVEGAFRVGSLQDSGKETLLTVLEAPHWFGEIGLFDGLPRTHNVEAVSEGAVLHLPQRPLLALLSQQPGWWKDLSLLVTAKLRLTFQVMEELARLPVKGRIAHRLVMLAEGHGDLEGRTRRGIKLSQEQLGSMVYASRQTTNPWLKELENLGLIRLSYGEIEILDLDGLRREADLPSELE